MKIRIENGLPLVEAVLVHNNNRLLLENVLVDTGSASTLISAEDAINLNLKPEPWDTIRSMVRAVNTASKEPASVPLDAANS